MAIRILKWIISSFSLHFIVRTYHWWRKPCFVIRFLQSDREPGARLSTLDLHLYDAICFICLSPAETRYDLYGGDSGVIRIKTQLQTLLMLLNIVLPWGDDGFPTKNDWLISWSGRVPATSRHHLIRQGRMLQWSKWKNKISSLAWSDQTQINAGSPW